MIHRLNRTDVERQVSEMWDAMASTPRDETYDAAAAQAQKIEYDLRGRLAAQDRLDETASALLTAAKDLLGQYDNSGKGWYGYGETHSAIAALRAAVVAAGEQPA